MSLLDAARLKAATNAAALWNLARMLRFRATPDVRERPRVQSALNHEERRLHPPSRKARVHAAPAMLPQARLLLVIVTASHVLHRERVLHGHRPRTPSRVLARGGVGTKPAIEADGLELLHRGREHRPHIVGLQHGGHAPRGRARE